jgi:hypothetical protein
MDDPDMTTSQTYEDYIKLMSIFELEPPPTPDELEGAGLRNVAHDEYLKTNNEQSRWIDICSFLYNRWFWNGTKTVYDMCKPPETIKDMRRASDYFFNQLPLTEQKRFRQLRAQPIEL